MPDWYSNIEKTVFHFWRD